MIRDGLKIDPKKYTRMKERLVDVSEETTTGVKRLYQMQANGTMLFPAINVNDSATKSNIWALAIGKKTEMLATDGGDAVVNLWHDCTAADKEEAFRKEEKDVLRGQELENTVLDADYTRATQLAFELGRPHKLFELFSELCR
ncbi:hypothetical protein ACS0TY_026648 [Phlomoides rotata]